MTFSFPLALLLLLVIPVVIYIGRPRVAFRRGRDLASLILRTAILLLLILALAGAQAAQAADKLAVVFLVDMSDSVGGTDRQIDFMREALQAMRPEDEAAIVAFGANALVERPMSSVREITPLRSTPLTGNTDLQEAISLGLALFPADAAKRIVILSDGLQTVGDAEIAARRAAATGVEISFVPFTRVEQVPEVLVSDVRVPTSVGAGQLFDLSLTVTAEAATPAAITVFAGGSIIHRQDVDLRQGVNHFALTLQSGESGFRDFRVQVDPVGSDNFYQNNGLAAFSRVVGAPRVLVVTQSADEAVNLTRALEEQGLLVDVVGPNDLPIGVAALADYNSILLNNIPATVLSNERMETLQTFVRDLGGGLVTIGGEDAYAPGGYFETPLEEMLPVEMQIRDQQRLPQITLVYVIDRSGSMSLVGPSGVANIELAKEAIIRSINFLQRNDRAGVISFDTDGYWVLDMQPVLDRLYLQAQVGTLSAGGGTDILAGMRLAGEAMQTETSDRKHIILLTDGGADPGGLVELTQSLNTDYGVTTSVISIGESTVGFLRQMADVGGGNYHEVMAVETIPQIFAQETVLATRSYIIEGEFNPVLSAISPIMEGISEAPSLLGYVATTPKDTAQVILSGPEPFSDPVLAAWQYGLGRAVAYTSDVSGRWSGNWVSWEGFARFWSQTVRWTITEGTDQNLESRIVMEGERARLTVDARADDGSFLNGLNLIGSLVYPDRSAVGIQLEQVAPGRYEATFTPGAEGAYFVRVSEADGALNQTGGWVMSYSPEYSTRSDAESILPDLAELTSGTRQPLDNAAQAFAHTLQAQVATNPLAPTLLLIAVLLLPFDIAVRRLIITQSDLARLRRWLSPPEVVPDATERVSALMGAKARAQEKTSVTATQVTPTGEPTAGGETPAPQKIKVAPNAPPPIRGAPTLKESDEGNIAGKLLQKRKDRGGGS
ncbi:MAG: VWA domain-containing protein [Anaerolineae bacterium]|nr:VWA domain-containing protein [Anaerolineae bacterium]